MIVNTIIVGLGQVGFKYDLKKKTIDTHCKSIFRHKGFNLSGVVDTENYLKKIFLKKYRKPFFFSIKTAIKNLKPDFVIISTPTELHYKNIKEVIKFNYFKTVKYILCEKPLSYNYYEAKKIINICKKNNIKLFVNFQRAYDSRFKILKKILKTNKYFGILNYTRGMLNNGSHFLNLFIYLFGYPNKIFKIYSKKINNFDFHFCGFIKFKNFSVLFSPSKKKESFHEFTIFNKKIIINYNNKINKIVIKKPYSLLSADYNKKIHYKNNQHKSSQMNVLNEIYNFITNRGNQICSDKDGLKTSFYLDKIKKI